MNQESLAPLSSEAQSLQGGYYEHFKGGRYELVGVARSSENPQEELVIYRSLIDPTLIWARPLKMFIEEVEWDGKHFPRFRYLGQNLM